MPMIDVYAEPGTFIDPRGLAARLAATLMEIEQVPDISLFRTNTAAFVHECTVSNVDGERGYVRVQVLTNAGALDRAKQQDAVRRLTAVVADAAGDPTVAERTWVQLTQTYDGGWGLGGHARTNDELVALARAELAASAAPGGGPDPAPRGGADLLHEG